MKPSGIFIAGTLFKVHSFLTGMREVRIVAMALEYPKP